MRLGALLLTWCLTLSAWAQAPPGALLPGYRILLTSTDPDWCLTTRVAEDGRLDLDQIGRRVPVALMMPKDAADLVLSVLRGAGVHIADLRIQIQTEQGDRIAIEGSVAHPLSGRFGKPVSLTWILDQAQPLAQADLDEIIIWSEDGVERVVSSSDNVLIHGGDLIEVTASEGATDIVVAGGVAKPVSLRFTRGMTVGDALSAAGGIATVGDPARVTLTRRGEIVPLVWPDDQNMQLKPGETVRVDLRPDRRYVVVTGDVPHPGLIDYAPGMTATQAVDAAGGVSKDPTKELVSVRDYLAGGKPPVRLSWAFLKALRIPDPVLVPDQIVEVSRAK